MNKKVVIGISGGVDSSTAAYLLKKDGYEVYGVTLSLYENFSEENFSDGIDVCKKLGIPLKIINVYKEFKSTVIDYFLEEYNSGMTPSPCVICDEKIKFYFLNEYAKEIGAQYISTGHYAQVEFSEQFNCSLLKVPKDKKKDQSYMLYRLSPEILNKLVFPLFNYEKTAIREIAREFGLKVHDKKDSQGICFAQEGYIPFLQKNLRDKIKKGDFILENGEKVGEHLGYQLYTIGQRRGLGLTLPRAYFIVNIIPEKNQIILGEYSSLMKDRVMLVDVHLSISMDEIKKLPLIAKPRFSSSGIKGSLVYENNSFYFIFDTPTPQNAPGQHLVFYYADYVLGGGKIVF